MNITQDTEIITQEISEANIEIIFQETLEETIGDIFEVIIEVISGETILINTSFNGVISEQKI